MAVHAENRKAYFDFEILEPFEAGIELFGYEVKAVKAHRINLEGSYVFPRMGALWLVGATIAPYQVNNTPEGYDQMRERKLLLHKKEIDYLLGKFSTKGLTILPMRVYDKGPRIKIQIAVAHKRKLHDKRERTRERETDRTISRVMKEI